MKKLIINLKNLLNELVSPPKKTFRSKEKTYNSPSRGLPQKNLTLKDMDHIQKRNATLKKILVYAIGLTLLSIGFIFFIFHIGTSVAGPFGPKVISKLYFLIYGVPISFCKCSHYLQDLLGFPLQIGNTHYSYDVIQDGVNLWRNIYIHKGNHSLLTIVYESNPKAFLELAETNSSVNQYLATFVHLEDALNRYLLLHQISIEEFSEFYHTYYHLNFKPL